LDIFNYLDSLIVETTSSAKTYLYMSICINKYMQQGYFTYNFHIREYDLKSLKSGLILADEIVECEQYREENNLNLRYSHVSCAQIIN
jgi:hypothetical protein